MITTEEKEKIVEVVGAQHLVKFMKWCKKNKLTRLDGKPYGKNMLSRVLNGTLKNKRVEVGWIEFAAECLEEREKEKAKRAQFLNRLKTADI